MSKKYTGWILSLASVLILALAGCGESDIEKASSDNSDGEATEDVEVAENTEDAPKETENLKIGESVNFDGVKVTLNEARVEPGGEFDTPENDKFVVVNLTAENTTDEEVTMSSIMNLELFDEEGYSYSTTILTEGTKGQFDGAIPAGKKLRGEVPFDVPDSETYELHFSDPFQSGKAIWVLDASELGE